MSDKKKGWVPKSFKDSGTGKYFEGGQFHEFEPGAFANYVAGRKVLTEKPSASPKADAKSSSAGAPTA